MAFMGEMHYLTIGGNTYKLPSSGGSGTVTSVGVANATNGGLSVSGSPITSSGTITIGLASGYGDTKNPYASKTKNYVLAAPATANGVPTFRALVAADIPISDWAKASTKPSYNFSEIGSKPTTLSGYGITDAYTKTQVDGLVSGVLHYKGTKATVSALPTSGNTTGDVWHVTADGSEWAWDGSAWQELGTAVDLSGYAQLSGASFTGPVTFGDSVTADELETGDLVVTGASSFTNNISANTINGVTVGSSPKFTDSEVSTLTLASGSTAGTSLSFGSKYTLTAGSKTVSFTMPSSPTVPTITLNGSATTSPSFYAPTGAGSSGQYLKSNGSGAPSWTNFPTIPTITLNGSATTSPSFYAPTSAGTSGYYLKSNGSGAPTWKAFPTIPTITDTYSSTSSNGMSGKAVASALGSYLPLSGGTMTGPITMAHGVSNAIHGTLQDGSSALPMLSMTYGDSTVENYIALGATNNNIPIGIYGSNVYLTNGGTLTIQGNLTINGHETPIGDVVPANKTQNIATGTSWVTTGCSVSLTEGVWVVVGSIEYAANATGRRGVEIYANGNMTHTQVNVAAGSNATTRLVTAGILEISAASMNVYIYGYQNSGSSLSQTTYMRAVRIR